MDNIGRLTLLSKDCRLPTLGCQHTQQHAHNLVTTGVCAVRAAQLPAPHRGRRMDSHQISQGCPAKHRIQCSTCPTTPLHNRFAKRLAQHTITEPISTVKQTQHWECAASPPPHLPYKRALLDVAPLAQRGQRLGALVQPAQRAQHKVPPSYQAGLPPLGPRGQQGPAIL